MPAGRDVLISLQAGALLGLWLSLPAPAAFADGHIRGTCIVGESELEHGRRDLQAIDEMRRYAQLYVGNFQKFRKAERDIRDDVNELLELDQWTQADIISFTGLQRELLYLSAGGQLATGRITEDELATYAGTIRQKITEIEIELGCEVLPGN